MRSLVPALAGAALSLSAVRADTVSLQASRDNTLFESMSGAVSNGAGPNIYTGRNSQGSLRRALLRFDLSAIPAGSTITGVSLSLFASQTQGPAVNVGLHRTLADWGEGISSSAGGQGAPSQPGDATWIHTFFNTSFWASTGGDFAPGASASTSVFEPGFYTWNSTASLVTDAQGWLDNPASNFGWTIAGGESASGTAKRFDSRENTLMANRPVLNVEYVVPAPHAAGFLALVGLTACRRRRS
jgi:hypothetical protein